MKFKMLLVSLAAASMTAAATAQTASPDFTPEAFRAHVGFLADDLLEGREAGTRGYDIAARYVAAQFEALGLRPGAPGGWFQPIEFVRIRTAGTPRLTVGDQVLANGEGIVFRPSARGEALALEAPLVFAGYGLDMPARGFDDYRGLDARGKIVVVLDGYPEGTPSDVGAHLSSDKARMAAARGAVGLIIVRTRADADGAARRRSQAMASRPLTTWVGPDGRAFAPHDLAFTATLDRAAAEPLFAEAGHPLDRVIAGTPRPGGFDFAVPARVEREAATSDGFTSPNVIAILPGTDPALADEYVLLMAHLDHIGVRPEGAGNAGEDRINNGAMDNATGIATLIEVARELSEPGNRPRRPVIFAAVTAEEKGLLGAEYLANNPVVDGRIAAVVNLDMPVLTYDFRDVIAFGAEHSTMGPIVERAAARMGVALTPDPLPEQGLFTRSDHYEFVRVGVPSVFLMTGFAGEGRERFTHFLQNEYHSPRDDMALPFDWNAGARFAQLNYLIAREIANSDDAPLWYADSFFGDAFARDQRRAERPAGAPQAASR